MKKLSKQVYNYTAVFEENENGGYTVLVPALPGLVTEGKNLEHAKEMAEDAILCYVGGLKTAHEEIPEEGNIAHLRLSVAV
ncbi:MAG: type II toxin-antitoxin system HicB family antitoxin [Candidatus Paceibacterota bacterium]|jgi:predicted RNase H-like HicB family nuclease